jgi:DNA invertase Pin-like site-specific DNA recombinase
MSAERVVIYVRVSTGLQNPEMQTNELKEYAARRGFQIVGEFTDIMTGSRDDRPELNKALTHCKQRQADVLLVWKLDRLGHSLRHLVNLVAELEAVGVAFISLRDNLDFGTPAGHLMFAVMDATAQFERDLIREHTRAGLANARRKGVRLGARPVKGDALTILRFRRNVAAVGL